MGLILAVLMGVAHAQTASPAPAPVHFAAFDLFIDSGKQQLAAYQIEISARGRNAKIVGIEGGEHPAFKEPPFYDPKAIQTERVILAAFKPAGELPSGKIRVATLHWQVTGEATAEFDIKVHTAGTANGKKIPAQAQWEERKTK